MTDASDELISQLRALSEASFVGVGVHRFVRDYGQLCAMPKCAPRVRRGRMKNCYGNALRHAMRTGARYVEGFAGDAWTQHAWCLADDGTVIDPTWGWDPERAYYGVVFTVQDACALTGDEYGVLTLCALSDSRPLIEAARRGRSALGG